jgi:hypothetical protein
MAIFTNKRLANPLQVTTSSQTFYTVPTNKSTILTTLTVANAVSHEVNVSLYLCVSDDAPTNANILIPNVPVVGNSLANFNFGQIIHVGDTIKVIASENNAITLHGSGIEIG